MVIYAGDSGAGKATYGDNKPHTIYYQVTVSAPGKVSFISSPDAKGPQFRLIYKRITIPVWEAGSILPRLPGEFKTY